MKFTPATASLFIAASLLSSQVLAKSAPYNYVKNGATLYQDALLKSKLQSPNSSSVLYEETSFDNQYDEDAFYIPDNSTTMELRIDGARSSRTELRHLTNFNSTGNNQMEGRLKVQSVSSSIEEVTVLQIHNEEAPAPLMRIALIQEDGEKYYQAKIREDDVCKTCDVDYETYEWTSSVSSSAYNNFLVKVDNKEITMTIGSETFIHPINEGWRTSEFYFKAGVYIQQAGTASVRFSKLEW